MQARLGFNNYEISALFFHMLSYVCLNYTNFPEHTFMNFKKLHSEFKFCVARLMFTNHENQHTRTLRIALSRIFWISVGSGMKTVSPENFKVYLSESISTHKKMLFFEPTFEFEIENVWCSACERRPLTKERLLEYDQTVAIPCAQSNEAKEVAREPS